MSTLVEKSFLVGLGVFSLTREEIRRLLEELGKRGEVSRSEFQEVIDRLATRGEQERQELRRWMQGEIEKAVSTANLASKKDLEALEKRLTALEEKLAQKPFGD